MGSLSTAFFVVIFVALFTGEPAEAQACGSECNCEGGILHWSHENGSGCMGQNNPHWSHLANEGPCDLGEGGAKNCNGCYACCNGWFVGRLECICDFMGQGKPACIAASQNTRDTCRGECTGTWQGNGCTNPEELVDEPFE